MSRIWPSVCILFCALSMESGLAFEGAGTGSFAEKINVKSCGAYQGSDLAGEFRMDSGDWSITIPSGILSGTYDTVREEKRFTLELDESSHLALISWLEARSDELCDSAPGSNTISSLHIRNFRANLNKTQTKAKLNIKVSAIRYDGSESGTITYSLKGRTDFTAFGCGTRQASMKLSWMKAVTAPDLNADGAIDLVFTQTSARVKLTNIDLNNRRADSKNIYSSQVVIYLQDPFAPGVFQRQPDIPILPDTKGETIFKGLPSVATGDLDGEGITDIAIPDDYRRMIGVLPQDPGRPGSFLQLREFPLPYAPLDIAIGDLNGDGFKDVAVAGENLSLLMNDPRTPGIVFEERTLQVGNVSSVAIADIDGDGRTDLAVTTGDSVLVLLQEPEPVSPGSFITAGPLYATGANAADVAIGDLNGDSLPDLAVANRGLADGSVSVLFQDAAEIGKFLPAADYITRENSQRVTIHDLNNDGLPDLAVANNDYEGGSVSVLLQNAGTPGAFLAATNYPGLSGPDDLATEDVNGDGLADLVVADKCSDYRERPYIRYQDSNNPGNFLPPAYLP